MPMMSWLPACGIYIVSTYLVKTCERTANFKLTMTLASMVSTAHQIRLILGCLLLTAVWFPSFYQPALNHVWNFLCHTSVYRWSTFETLWTVFCYAAIEVPLTVVFMKHPEWRFLSPKQGVSNKSEPGQETCAVPKPRGMRRPSRRPLEALTYVTPLIAMDLTMIKKFADVSLADILETGNIDRNTNGPSKSFLVPTLHNFTLASPVQSWRALPTVAPTSRRLATELAASFLIYDALFFLFHLCLHLTPVLWSWHAPHHAHDAQLNPQVTNQLSIPERLGLVLLANFSLNIIGSHVFTRTLFVPLFVWMLVEIHSGMDLPWGYEKILPAGWGGGARKHMRHHVLGKYGFEPFFCWWDALWEWFLGRAMNG